MSDIKQPDPSVPEPVVPGSDNHGAPAVDRSRRRLAGAGLSASVLMTLASRSALADHCTVSGMLSGNLSRPDADVQCFGKRPSYWKRNPNNWPTYSCGPCNPITYVGGACTDYSVPTNYELVQARDAGQITQAQIDAYVAEMPGTPFSYCFGSGICEDPDTTLMQALWMGNSSLLGQCVAAILNAHHYGAQAYGYTPQEVVTLVHNGMIAPTKLTSDLATLNYR